MYKQIGLRLTKAQTAMLHAIRDDLAEDWPAGVALPTLADAMRTCLHAEHQRLVGEEAHRRLLEGD